MSMKYIGYCANTQCEKSGQVIKFPVKVDQVEAYRNEPETCVLCGEFLQGDIYEV